MIPSGASFSVGDVLYKTFSTYFRNLPQLLLIALLFQAPVVIYGLVAGVPDDQDAFVTYTVISMVAGLLLFAMMMGAVMYLVVEDLNGRRAEIGASLRIGLTRAVPTLVVAILVYLLSVIAMFPLIFPGWIVWCILFVAVPASVIERPGIFGALGRSAKLTKGNRWQLFGLNILFVLIVVGFFIVLALVFPDAYSEERTVITDDDWALRVVSNAVSQMVTFAFGSVLSATAYVALRADKEGVGAVDLATVFE